MKHATPDTLATLTPFLEELRGLPQLRERSPGVFYLKSRAFLHFHEHQGLLYADVRLAGADFDRFPASSREDQRALLRAIREKLG